MTNLIHKFILICVLVGQLAAQQAQACDMSHPQPVETLTQSASIAHHENHQDMDHDMHQGHHMDTDQVTMDMACCDDCQCLMNLCHSNWLLTSSQLPIFADTRHNTDSIRQPHWLHHPPDNLFRPPIV